MLYILLAAHKLPIDYHEYLRVFTNWAYLYFRTPVRHICSISPRAHTNSTGLANVTEARTVAGVTKRLIAVRRKELPSVVKQERSRVYVEKVIL